jgi:hypothetical protein
MRTLKVCQLAEGQTVQSWKAACILFAITVLVLQTSMPSRGDDSVDSGYQVCHDSCVAATHKCVDQIVPSFSQERADDVRTQCGEALDACLAACQQDAAASFRKRHPSKKTGG